MQTTDMGIIHTFKCQNWKYLIWTAVAVINGELPGDAGSPD
jgi:hypothetical protein